MSTDFLLPDLGEGLLEAEIVQWLVGEGDEVALNQTLAEVETAKAVVEIPSPHAGVVHTLHAAAGDTVAVGSPLVSFSIDADADGADEGQDAGAQANLVGYGAGGTTSTRPRRRARVGAPAPASSDRPDADPPTERPRSTPPVRRLAKDLGVDLAAVPPSAADGTITRADVEAFARTAAGGDLAVRPAGREGSAPAVTPAGPEVPAPTVPVVGMSAGATTAEETRIPIRGVRKHTAAAMVRSAFTAPHASTFLTVDATETIELLASLKGDRALDGHRVGVLAVVAKAVCLALRRTPELNAHWDEEAGEIVRYARVGLGIAVATDRGLVVPNVPAADTLPLVDLADAVGEFVDTARRGRTEPARLSGGTFTITNVGALGVDAGTPILNPGEAGILALGAVRRTPWEFRGEIALREVVTLSLSFDHRLVDGAEAARFLADVGAVLREPGRALLLA